MGGPAGDPRAHRSLLRGRGRAGLCARRERGCAASPRPPLADPWLRELARLLPEILVERPDLPPPGPLTEEWQRLRLFEALAHGLLPGHAALLLFLDDLQWCDRDTLDWLDYLLQAGAATTSPCAVARRRHRPAGGGEQGGARTPGRPG